MHANGALLGEILTLTLSLASTSAIVYGFAGLPFVVLCVSLLGARVKQAVRVIRDAFVCIVVHLHNLGYKSTAHRSSRKAVRLNDLVHISFLNTRLVIP